MSPIGAALETGDQCDRDSGIVSIRCTRPIDQIVTDLKQLLQAKGAKLFATVDHAAEARAAGLQMPPTVLLIFGNPRGGTPAMLASPLIAIDLPLKLLVSQDSEGVVWISYIAPSCLQQRYDLSADLAQPLSVVEALATTVATRT